MAQGIIEDPMTKIEWHSCQNLTSEELVIIANTAKKVKNSVEILKKCSNKNWWLKTVLASNSNNDVLFTISKHSKCLYEDNFALDFAFFSNGYNKKLQW